MTFCMSSRHSNQLSYAPVSVDIIAHLSGDCKGFFKISQIFSAGVPGTYKIEFVKNELPCEEGGVFCVFTSFHV